MYNKKILLKDGKIIIDNENKLLVDIPTEEKDPERVAKVRVPAGTSEQHLLPNKYYIFESQLASPITITLEEEDPDYLEEYMGELLTDENDAYLYVPSYIRWNCSDNSSRTVEEGFTAIKLDAKFTHIFSIMNNLGLISSFSNGELAKPIVTVDGTVATWEPIEGAEEYQLWTGNALGTSAPTTYLASTTECSIDFESYEDPEALLATPYHIVAVSKHLADSYSDKFTSPVKLTTPTNLVLNDSYQLSWDSVTNATGYKLKLIETGEISSSTYTVNYCSLVSENSILMPFEALNTPGTYHIAVSAVNTTSTYPIYLESDYSESIEVIIK